jgi:hypothetical protein
MSVRFCLCCVVFVRVCGFCVCFYVCVLGKGLGDGFWADKKLTNKPPHEVCVNLYVSSFWSLLCGGLCFMYVVFSLSLARSLSLSLSSFARALLTYIYAL